MAAFIPVSAAQASTSIISPPKPCSSINSAALHSLFGVRNSVRLTLTPASSGKGTNKVNSCIVIYQGHLLMVSAKLHATKFDGPFRCYTKPALGSKGRVCVSTSSQLKNTWGMFYKKGVYFYDLYTVTLPSQGARMYSFALAQYKNI